MIEPLSVSFCFANNNWPQLSAFVFINMTEALWGNRILDSFLNRFYFFFLNSGIGNPRVWTRWWVHTTPASSIISSNCTLKPNMIHQQCAVCQRRYYLEKFTHLFPNPNGISNIINIPFPGFPWGWRLDSNYILDVSFYQRYIFFHIWFRGIVYFFWRIIWLLWGLYIIVISRDWIFNFFIFFSFVVSNSPPHDIITDLVCFLFSFFLYLSVQLSISVSRCSSSSYGGYNYGVYF